MEPQRKNKSGDKQGGKKVFVFSELTQHDSEQTMNRDLAMLSSVSSIKDKAQS